MSHEAMVEVLLAMVAIALVGITTTILYTTKLKSKQYV